MYGQFWHAKFQTSLLLYVLEHLTVEERACNTHHVGVGRLGTLAYNSFRWPAIRMFNQLPLFLRNITVCSVYSFKKKLVLYVCTLLDIPCQLGFVPPNTVTRRAINVTRSIMFSNYYHNIPLHAFFYRRKYNKHLIYYTIKLILPLTWFPLQGHK